MFAFFDVTRRVAQASYSAVPLPGDSHTLETTQEASSEVPINYLYGSTGHCDRTMLTTC